MFMITITGESVALLYLELLSIRTHAAALTTSLACPRPRAEPTATGDTAGGPRVPAAPVTWCQTRMC